jgi:Flp pilus assembly protein TadG
MSHPGRIVELAGNERGAVLVMFAVFAPVAVLLAAFALDTGNWFLHKRHLQLQADAGALAAAQMFQPCSDSAIKSAVEQYSGAAASSYNPQIGGTSLSNIHELINSKTFYNQPSSPKPDDTVTAEPCAAQMVDVKLTETNLPWYWRLFSTVPYIDPRETADDLRLLRDVCMQCRAQKRPDEQRPERMEQHRSPISLRRSQARSRCTGRGQRPLDPHGQHDNRLPDVLRHLLRCQLGGRWPDAYPGLYRQRQRYDERPNSAQGAAVWRAGGVLRRVLLEPFEQLWAGRQRGSRLGHRGAPNGFGR